MSVITKKAYVYVQEFLIGSIFFMKGAVIQLDEYVRLTGLSELNNGYTTRIYIPDLKKVGEGAWLPFWAQNQLRDVGRLVTDNVELAKVLLGGL